MVLGRKTDGIRLSCRDFGGSARGSKVKTYLDGAEPLYTPSICLTEMKSRYLMDKRDPTPSLSFIVERSFIIPLDQGVALRAADIRLEYSLNTVNAVIYATAMEKGMPVITGDQNFKDLPNVEMI